MREEWRPVVGYEELYEVSNMGNVKSLERTVWDSVRGYYRTIPERILKVRKASNGYLQVQLCKDGKVKGYLVHRLVATVFCENPMGYTEVNHKDENKENNCIDNLEWCSRSYNNTYGTRNKKIAEKKKGRKQSEEHIKKRVEKLSKPVLAIHKVSGLILEFTSAREAEKETGIAYQSICACCKGKLNSAGGFYWMYANVNDAE